MFEKIYLDRKATLYFYVLMNFALNVIYYLMIGIFVYFLWEQRYIYVDLFQTEKLMKAHQYNNWAEYTSLVYNVGMEFFYLAIKLFIVSSLIRVIKYCKVPNIWLKKWDDDGQIDPVFGRNLCEHLRIYSKINFKDFYSIHSLSRLENYNLYKINKDKNLNYLLNKYDNSFNKDINN